MNKAFLLLFLSLFSASVSALKIDLETRSVTPGKKLEFTVKPDSALKDDEFIEVTIPGLPLEKRIFTVSSKKPYKVSFVVPETMEGSSFVYSRLYHNGIYTSGGTERIEINASKKTILPGSLAFSIQDDFILPEKSMPMPVYLTANSLEDSSRFFLPLSIVRFEVLDVVTGKVTEGLKVTSDGFLLPKAKGEYLVLAKAGKSVAQKRVTVTQSLSQILSEKE